MSKKKAAEATSPHIEDQGDSGSALSAIASYGPAPLCAEFLALAALLRVSSSTDKERRISLSVCRANLIRCNLFASVAAVVRLDKTTAFTHMAGRQAKILSADDVGDLLTFASVSRHPLRNRVIVLLSAKAGLRAGEIAQLTWDMVVDGSGRLADLIELRDCATKRGSGRRIPIHPDLAAALAEWRQTAGPSDYVIRSERGGPMTPLGIVVWFNRAFKNIGLRGCSSHSGRRTFVTRAARAVHAAGGSLRDVQLLAGHASIQTTEQYIDGDTDAQRKLVAMI